MSTSEDDRRLLELAAKAAGIESQGWGSDYYADGPFGDRFVEGLHTNEGVWNPLADDGDALRLAVRLGMSVEVAPRVAVAWVRPTPGKSLIDCTEELGADPEAATRRAIVRAAAEIGKTT